MPNFEKTAQDEQRFAEFIGKIDKTIDTLSPYSDYTDLSQLEKLREEFNNKISDFYREDRKLNIGVIGQVKAGKSSFLNTLLFNGKKVLPSAATPKTATLTRIEYSEENKIVVEYYSADEWKILEENARVDSTENEFEAAREIVRMCAEKGLNARELIAKQTDEFSFGTADELMEKLDDYVGENGTYTALVKNVTICINNPDLKDISVVDTPGLNDAIVSRTDRTRQFIGLCDVVFFLSRASQFLDKNDMRLLTSQLPQNGVKKIVMICSRFDDGITDVIYDVNSIDEALSELRNSLGKRARDTFNSKNLTPSILETIGDCKEPIFVSSMCWNMHQKDAANYDDQEKKIFDDINEYGDVDDTVLKKVGNIDAVQKIYGEVVSDKDNTLSQKARSFVPDAENEYSRVMKALKDTAAKKADILRSGDCSELTKQKKALADQINGIKGSVEAIFGEILVRIEQEKLNTMRKIRDTRDDCAQINDKTGTETVAHNVTVSDSKWYKPWTWGKSHTETSYSTSTYIYVETSDALENIRHFANRVCSDIEKTFADCLDIIGTKRKLLNAVVENFDTSSELYDPTLIRLISEQTLNKFEFSTMSLDISNEQNAISSKFSGEIRNSSDRSQFKTLLSGTLTGLMSTVESKFSSEVASFRGKIENMKTGFCESLLNDIENDFDLLIKQIENKENEIRNYENLLVLFDSIK